MLMQIAIAALLASAMSPTAQAKHQDPVAAALRSIPSAGGPSVLDRIKACNIRIQREASWIEKEALGISKQKILPGDTILQIVIDVPPLRGDSPALYRDLTARWIIRNGKATPASGWADQLQNKKPPIGSLAWMNC
jgi:hypothetical protein